MRIRRSVMRWFLIFVLSAFPALSEVARPETLDDTLRAMAGAFEETGLFTSVEIDWEDKSVALRSEQSDNQTSYPDNLHKSLQNAESDDERQAILDQFILAISDSIQIQNPDGLDVANVLPVVRHIDFGANGGNTGPVFDPLVGELGIFYVIDMPASLSYLTAEKLEELKIDRDELAGLAAKNFEKRGWEPKLEGDGIWMLTLDGNYEASFLLDTPFWQNIDNQLETVLMIALARDVVLFTDASFDGAEDQLRRISNENFAGMNYQLSPEVFVWVEDRWELR